MCQKLNLMNYYSISMYSGSTESKNKMDNHWFWFLSKCISQFAVSGVKAEQILRNTEGDYDFKSKLFDEKEEQPC